MNIIAKKLFSTKALEIAHEDKPFWYTSGDFGPYYINTHYLYGNKEKAEGLLTYINENMHEKEQFPYKIRNKVKENYLSDPVYKAVTDYIADYIKNNMGKTDMISGGERRDWFFSYIIADILDLEHITIYKDNELIVTHGDKIKEYDSLEGVKILHIADLITKASSYLRNWIPALLSISGKILYSLSVVDRNQGGLDILKDSGIEPYSCVTFDSLLFKQAYDESVINEKQYEMIIDFLDSPEGFMMNYINKNPFFLKNSLKSDDRIKQRALIFVNKYDYRL